MKEKSMLKNEDGSILIVTVLILLLLTFLGFWGHNTTVTELQIAGSDKSIKTVFYAADAGIEVGRAALGELKRTNKGNWDRLLQGLDITGHTVGFTTIDDIIEDDGGTRDATRRDVGRATFTLTVRDNDDLDGDDTIDSDNIIILTSIATFGDARAQVEAYLRFDEDEYKQEHYDAFSTGVAE